MGGSSSVPLISDDEPSQSTADSNREMTVEDLPQNKRWHQDKQYSAEDSVVYTENASVQVLRNMLDEPLGQRYLADFAKMENSQENFFAWIDIEEFRTIPTPDFRRCRARHIYKKYIKTGAVMQLGGITPDQIEKYTKMILGDKDNKENISENMFRPLQHMVFREMVQNTFKRFKESEKYQEFKKVRRKLYNRVSTEDFQFIDFLGGGAFGKVIRVRKKSTKKEYAMKVISKSKMLEHLSHKDSKTKYERLNIERNVYVHTNFPFIIDMDYAFQTKSEVILVMEYARGGTLGQLIKSYPNKRLPEDCVKYVVAQTMLALRHLHYMNYVYRDLKPINVLMSADGCIKLADMGLVARIDDTIKVKSNAVDPKATIKEGSDYDEKPAGRRFTVVGTIGYKAPELLQVSQEKSEGYGASVDWWALGVMTYEMLVGNNPFTPKLKTVIIEGDSSKAEMNAIKSVVKPSNSIPDDVKVSAECKSFIDDLLMHDPKERLGTSSTGVAGIKAHAFFADYDFNKLLDGQIPAPYEMPWVDKEELVVAPKWDCYDSMMKQLDTADLNSLIGRANDTEVSDRHQKYFTKWDYVSPSTFKLELGLQNIRLKESKVLTKEKPDMTFGPNSSCVQVQKLISNVSNIQESDRLAAIEKAKLQDKKMTERNIGV